MAYKFTKSAEIALEIANNIAIDLGHSYIGTEHLLMGILRDGDSIAVRILLSI